MYNVLSFFFVQFDSTKKKRSFMKLKLEFLCELRFFKTLVFRKKVSSSFTSRWSRLENSSLNSVKNPSPQLVGFFVSSFSVFPRHEFSCFETRYPLEATYPFLFLTVNDFCDSCPNTKNEVNTQRLKLLSERNIRMFSLQNERGF